LEEKVKERTKELEKTNRELIIAKEKVEQSDKMKSEFLHQMSLEMRSPTNAVLSFTNLLREEMLEKLTPDLLEYFDGIDSVGQRLIRTVDLILNVSEMQICTNKPFFGEFDLIKEIISKIINENKKIIENKGLKLNFFSVLSEAVIVGDKYSIYQIFVNLLGNSIKYTKKGDISIDISRNEQGINVSLEDTGVGISEEFMVMMYHPPMQEEKENSRSYEGNTLGLALVKKYCDLNGIGLALVKKYCDLNGIVFTIESKKGVGTKFTLVFTNTKFE
jgi:signal transduction histidine kinase